MTSRRTVLGMLAGVPLLASGCVSVPTTGPVAPVSPSATDLGAGGGIEVRPPEPGAIPSAIMDGFFNAMAINDLVQARQFLVPAIRDSWQPEGVLVYPVTEVQITAGRATLDVDRAFGQLNGGTFSRVTTSLKYDFGLQQVQGEWRIGSPPRSLLINRQLFGQFYAGYAIYYFDPTFTRLVPDPVFLAYRPDQPQLAGALIQRLIAGPAPALQSSVRSAIPPGTDLQGQAVVVTDGIADISLGDPLTNLSDDQRTQLAAQLAWTLSQVDDLRGLQLNDGRIQVAGSTSDGYYPIAAARDFGPVPDSTARLYGLAGDAVVEVDAVDNRADFRPLGGPLGGGLPDVGSVAVDLSNTTIAVVVGNDELRVGPLTAQPTTVLSGQGRLLRPQVVRIGAEPETWTVGRRSGADTIYVVRDGRSTSVTPPADLTDLALGAFRIAADGTRMAAIRRVNTGTELGIMAIDRSSDTPVLGGWRPVELLDIDPYAPLTVVIDVAWLGPTTLLVLAATGTEGSVGSYRVSQDGYSVAIAGSATNWAARSITAAPVVPTVPAVPARSLVVGSDTTSFTYSSQPSWEVFSTELRFLGYAG